MDEKRNRELWLKLLGQSEQERLPPGYELKSKSRFTVGDLSYTVRVCFVDLTTVVSGINFHSYSESNALIKYSEARFSPVSSEPTDYVKLATPSYYRNLKVGSNSELIADDLEGAYKEHLEWDYGVKVENTKALLSEFWIYCTSISPYLSSEREEQIKSLSPEYDFLTKMEEPSKFAEQLGYDVGKQIELCRDFNFNPGVWEFEDYIGEFGDRMSLMSDEQSTGGQDKSPDDYLISVNHGPVIYLGEGEIAESINSAPTRSSGAIIPFLKRKKYEEQQEYRFIIRVRHHSPKGDTFYLKVSNELRNLMAPIENML